jgi:hypothetical protein
VSRPQPAQNAAEVEQKVLQARDAIPCFGPQRLKQEFGLPCSTGAIGRILRRHGRSRRRKKPRPPARSLARQKMEWPPFGLVQIDVKDLSALASHRCGVDLRPLVVQTDNGSEFGGAWNRRHGLPPFTKLVEQKYGCRQHRFHPLTAPPTQAT